MSVILLDKNKLHRLLKEGPVSGDKSAMNVAKAGEGIEKAKSRLSKLGIYNIPSLDGVTTIDQLSIEPFKFDFLLQVYDDQQELTLPKPEVFNTLARVKSFSENTLILEIKTDKGELFDLSFTNKDELVMRLPGTKKDIYALVSEDDKKGKFYTVTFNQKLVDTIKDSKEDGGYEGEVKEKDEVGNNDVNLYNGKDLKEVNLKLLDVKGRANFFSVIKQYKEDPEFQKIFLDAIINSTKSIKINKKPLLVTLKDLKNSGLLEAPASMSGRQRKFLKVKLELQNFMTDVFSLFAKVAKSGKQSKTFDVIKTFYKQLYIIASKGKSGTPNDKIQLWKKLMGSFSNFLRSLTKLPEMIKGKPSLDQKPKKEIKVNSTPKATMGTMEFYINSISKSIIKEEDGEENYVENEKIYNGKIYVKDITLGPKAKAKKTGDSKSYTNKMGGSLRGGWDGLVNSLPEKGLKANIDLKLVDESKLDAKQKSVFKTITNILKADSYKGGVVIRKSKKITDNKVFVIEFGGKALVCKAEQGAVLKKRNIVEIGPKMGGEDIFDKSTKAEIQITT